METENKMQRMIGSIGMWRRLGLLLAILGLALVACGPIAGTQRNGSTDPDDALLTWHREGGFAGFCDELNVLGDGRVVASTCRGGDDVVLGEATLTPDQRAQLDEWVSRLRSIDIEETDPATADAMTVRLALAGRGSEEVTDQELRAILDYVASLYLDTAGLPEGPTPTPEVFQPLPPEERAFAAARAALAAELGVDELTISLEEVTPQEWTDSCLGLGGPAESCLQVITPGYRLLLRAGDELYEVRTNLDASAVRIARGEHALAAARAALAAELGVDEMSISLEEVTPQEWTDSCLGLGGPAESCLQAITPGYRLLLRAGDELYEVRTNLDASAVRIAGIAEQ
jgi:hypothetical protein